MTTPPTYESPPSASPCSAFSAGLSSETTLWIPPPRSQETGKRRRSPSSFPCPKRSPASSTESSPGSRRPACNDRQGARPLASGAGDARHRRHLPRFGTYSVHRGLRHRWRAHCDRGGAEHRGRRGRHHARLHLSATCRVREGQRQLRQSLTPPRPWPS